MFLSFGLKRKLSPLIELVLMTLDFKYRPIFNRTTIFRNRLMRNELNVQITRFPFKNERCVLRKDETCRNTLQEKDSNIMMGCNTPSIDQTNEAVELSFFFL